MAVAVLLFSALAESPTRLRLASSSERPPAPESAQKSADYNLRILWPLARYIEDRRGTPALAELAGVAGLAAADFGGANHWVSAAAFEAIVAHSRSVLKDDDEFRVACVHRIAEAYGPLRYLTWATSPAIIYQQAVKTYPLVSAVGIPSVPAVARGRLHMRIEKDPRDLPFSRETCIVRQAQTAALPTFWGFPPAHVTETACVANGDASCELYFRWYEGRRWLPTVVGSMVGAAVAWGFARGILPSVAGSVAMVLAGSLLGYLYELRATDRVNEGTKHEIIKALHEVAVNEAEARREILELNKRQKEWTSLLEEEAALRAATMAQVAERIDKLQNARTTTVLGFSHDLKNPLHVIRMGISYLRENAVDLGVEGVDVVRDLDQSADAMQRMLQELMQVITNQRTLQRAPQRLEVMPLVDRLRRRLTALTFGKRIKVSVITNREAPEAIEIDPIVFDRIVDNLLTNASKYTERGSIVVDLDGTPGFLVLKVSDTGRGIAADDLERTFLAGGSDASTRGAMSWGIGLSVVVQLLDEIGGRLEVISRPNEGTTFWVHLPTATTKQLALSGAKENSEKTTTGALSRVVKIRKVQS
jgi:signal transduction histidine kinase